LNVDDITYNMLSVEDTPEHAAATPFEVWLGNR
jgi:hypothetical protein